MSGTFPSVCLNLEIQSLKMLFPTSADMRRKYTPFLASAFVASLLLFQNISFLTISAGREGDWPFGGKDAGRRNYAESERELMPPLILKWTQNVTDSYIDAITTGSGRVFLALEEGGGHPNRVLCLDEVSGKELWKYDIPNSGGAMDCAPAYFEDAIYVGGQVETSLHVLDAKTGSLKWSFKLNSSMYASAPAVVGGLVYVRSGTNIFAIDPATRSLKWKLQRTYAEFAFYGDTLFAQSSSYILALDRMTGVQKWNKSIGAAYWYNAPIVSGQSLFIMGAERDRFTLLSLSASDGSRKWTYYIDKGFTETGVFPGFLAEGNGVLCASLVNVTRTSGASIYNGKIVALD